MTVPTTGADPAHTPGECRHCTVPTDGAEMCTFCKTYTPPAEPSVAPLISGALKNATMAIEDCQDALAELPADAPLWSAVDLVTAIGHLRQTAINLDRAADLLNATRGEPRSGTTLAEQMREAADMIDSVTAEHATIALIETEVPR